MKEQFSVSQEVKPEVFQNKGEAKKCLHDLEATGTYIFHGSPNSHIAELEPRQAYDYTSGIKTAHGAPSIAATPHADIAIFRAVAYRGSTGFGKTDHVIEFRATQKALDLAKDYRGYVYVLSKETFSPFGENTGSMEWRSSVPQKPIRIIEVAFDDLPDGIKLME